MNIVMNIVLIGYRATGKSTVGSKLAAHLRRKFVDTDDLLEERHGTIEDIVKTYGWDHFRHLEKRVIQEISSQSDLVIAPGGGFVLDIDNVMALKKNGFIIWLKAGPQVVQARMMKDPQTLVQRPPLTGKGILQEIEEVMASRAPFYEQAAEAQLDTSTMDVAKVVEEVVSMIKARKRGG